MSWIKSLLYKNIKEEGPDFNVIVADANDDLPDFRKIAVPDLKQYLVNGYNEIREVRKQNDELQNELEATKKYKELYESTLIALNEFSKRDEENKDKISRLEIVIEKKNSELQDKQEIINTYKIREYELEEKERDLIELLKETERKAIGDYIEQLKIKINNQKGNISKVKLLSLIER